MAISTILGVDIGSVSVSVVEVGQHEVLRTDYRPHGGRAAETFAEILATWPLENVTAVVATSSTPKVIAADHRVDWVTAHVAAHRVLSPHDPILLVVGGERFLLLQFDEAGSYRSSRGNTSCAAGTGGFLDQQARRLGLASAAELADLATSNDQPRPKVASRCSVFAKTDLIHAQQEGHSVPAICDGLCDGLARNLVDAVVNGPLPQGRVVLVGGVAQNRAVVAHVGRMLERETVVDPLGSVHAALGAAIAAREENLPAREEPVSIATLIQEDQQEHAFYHEPLPEPTGYPQFDDHEQFVHTSSVHGIEVEVDRYLPAAAGRGPRAWDSPNAWDAATRPGVYLGFDIGSTSTKAVIMTPAKEVQSAYYTRTAGDPVSAVKAILETIDATDGLTGPVIGSACTGSGRKFIGGVIGADLVLDEITAHARAAVELDPTTDTIIEIGGQDAKFTTLRNGRVTFSQMNAVCAAGTGSFLEEQAARLGVPVTAYADRAIAEPAPLTSDRCTVFMERDINHFLNRGYTADQILAAALHSVRENYLQKVAEKSSIGTSVCFQGATAKNRGLVAAFEQRLGQPLRVSRYCHVTGALGAALVCMDEQQGLEQTPKETSRRVTGAFRGIDLYKVDIPVRTERCDLCANHCRLTVARVGEDQVAYGFLCGRDYDTQAHVSADTSGFDLIKERQKAYRAVARADSRRTPVLGLDKVIGIPAALHLADEEAFWRRTFAELGFRTVSSAGNRDAVAIGKQVEGAEFCTPVAAFHGHVVSLLEKADLIFVPMMLESQRESDRDLAYCYYTQFTTTMLAGAVSEEDHDRLLMPVLWGGDRDPVQELRRVLSPWVDLSEKSIELAMERAREAQAVAVHTLKELYYRHRNDGVNVVLLGRPYTAMDPTMNNAIPQILGKLGIVCFYQDMLPAALPSEEADKLLQSVHWRHAADILLAADLVSRTDGLYPIFITSFKCAPDAFCIDSFKRIMDARGKPYLVLQLDEHDSSVGYETRIEAAIRAFTNHRQEGVDRRPMVPAHTRVAPDLEYVIGEKTLLFPTWDPVTTPLLTANLRAHGIDAVELAETPLSIQRSMRLNSGQCIPVSAIAQDAMDYVAAHNLDPKKAILWMARSTWSCGIPLYPQFLKDLFVEEGMADLGVYLGEFTFIDISPAATIGAYFAYQFGGWLRSIACKIRPYERNKGQTDAVASAWVRRMVGVFERKENRLDALRRMVSDFDAIPRKVTNRPKVAIFGDLYVRDNDVMNQDLIHRIEEAGGEAVTTPYSDYIKIIAAARFGRMRQRREIIDLARFRLILGAIQTLERRYHREVSRYTGATVDWHRRGLENDLARFNMVLEQAGESYENALKILHLVSRYDDIALFVQASPAFCCPSLVTEALSNAIERIVGVPIVTITYDGTESDKNSVIVPYIKFPRTEKRLVEAIGAP